MEIKKKPSMLDSAVTRTGGSVMGLTQPGQVQQSIEQNRSTCRYAPPSGLVQKVFSDLAITPALPLKQKPSNIKQKHKAASFRPPTNRTPPDSTRRECR
ncbi:MAG TPA: hypothetical protein DET40_13945 [Lentisphaeria bacterium]|nr:MAG: hypothetical protein A2X45_05015 [Lentisphaerae bacterium GWF2_50_93]HCE44643.1 hypothetical protein [Lentisphaeria bacterium]